MKVSTTVLMRITSIAAFLTIVFAISFVRILFGADEIVHSLDTDPGWEKFGETAMGVPARHVIQDFGWRPTNKAGGDASGEIGGTIGRSLTRAVYWMKIPEKTLNDKLTISGRFAVAHTGNGSAMQFGFLNETSTGWRTPNSFVFRLSGEDKKTPSPTNKNVGQYSWAYADLANCNWKADGQGAYDGIYQTTNTRPIPSDGKPHEFQITYDPNGAGGRGETSVTIDGATWKNALEPGHKKEGAIFNRFGLMNVQTSGVGMEVYFSNIRMNGELLDLSKDPGWEGIGNKTQFDDRDIRPYHDFRWSNTNFAGGQPGEIAVTMWRDERPAYYADKVGPLTLNDALHADGRLAFTGAGSDSGVRLGWFSADAKRNMKDPEVNKSTPSFLAIAIEGPSRIGHYFRPEYTAATPNIHDEQKTGPIIRPDGRQHHWSIDYDPNAANGNGHIIVTLDGEKAELALNPEARKAGATFDRFGFFDMQNGGHFVKIFIDDVKYTAAH